MTTDTKDKQEIPAWAVALHEKVDKLQRENAMLKEIAGRSKVADYEDSKRDFTTKTVSFKVWDGKVIIGYGQKLDYSKFNNSASDARGENVFIEVHFLDGTKEKINYSDFSNIKELKIARIVDRGEKSTTVEFPEGETVVVDNTYLNA